MNKINYKISILLALISFCGAVVYRFYALNTLGISISLAISLTLFVFLMIKLNSSKKEYKIKIPKTLKKQKTNYSPYHISFIFLISICFFILFKSLTIDSIISPWQVIPKYFFLFYALASLNLILIAVKETKLTITAISIYYFLSFSVALIIYKIGYGFDPFIHEATLDLINKTGEVDPKPFYYLGQYSLVIILHKITFIPIEILNKFLVPVLASITLPAFLYSFLDNWFEEKTINKILLISVLSLPFSIFIISTPQNLAFLFLILLILSGLNCTTFSELLILYLFAFAILSIHPIAGIPAILFVLMLTVYHSDKKNIKKYLYLLIFISSCFALPLAFYIFNNGHLSFDLISSSFSYPTIPYKDNFILNIFYLYIFNIKLILAFLIIAGLYITCRQKEEIRVFKVCSAIGLSLLVSHFLTKFISFDFVIYYEQKNYLERMLTTTAIFFFPFILISFYSILEKILKQNFFVKLIIFTALSILITTSLYASYPRIDSHFNSRGYSTGKYDIEAVEWIEANSNNNYIVLANQQVSVAALKKFGFTKYYKDNIYFYPIPTSGPLYKYYLDMVYEKPNKKTMQSAMELAGVNESYFILNKYWWASPKILEEAKLEAKKYKKFGDGEVWVFEF